MGAKLIDSGALRDVNSPSQRRAENMALVFQEALTVIVRLRSNSQPVADPKKFRADMRGALQNSGREAVRIGYTPEDARLAIAAVTAFLDESISNSGNLAFSEWSQAPLHDELYGQQNAGEAFARHTRRLLGRDDSQELADVLEVYLLCLLLGYKGSCRPTEKVEREAGQQAIVDIVTERIRRIRQPPEILPLTWSLPEEPAIVDGSKSGARRWWVVAGICVVAAVMVFAGIRLWMRMGSK
jgi:type VI secretion system protein ImpK